MSKTPPSKQFINQQYYLSNRDFQLQSQKAAYWTDPEKFRRRRREYVAEHTAEVVAYNAYYAKSHSNQINARRRLRYFDNYVARKPGALQGINNLIEAAATIEAPLGSHPPVIAQGPNLLTDRAAPSTASLVVNPEPPSFGNLVCNRPNDDTSDRVPKAAGPILAGNPGNAAASLGRNPQDAHHEVPPKSPDAAAIPQSTRPLRKRLPLVKPPPTRRQCWDPKTGTLCPWRRHSQSGTEFGYTQFPRTEGHYAFSPTEYQYWNQLEHGGYEEKSGNLFICRLCKQKALGESVSERGHAAFCRKSTTGGRSAMARRMADYKKRNNRAPARVATLTKGSCPVPADQYWEPRRQAARPSAPPKRRCSPRSNPAPASVLNRKRKSIPQLTEIARITKQAKTSTPRTAPAVSNRKRKQASNTSAIASTTKRTKTSRPVSNHKRKPSPKGIKSSKRRKISQPAKPNRGASPRSKSPKKATIVRQPPRCFGKEPSYVATLRRYSDAKEYRNICTPDGKQLLSRYQIYKDGQPLHLERSAKFLQDLRRNRLKHATVDAKISNAEFEKKYSRCVFAAMEAAKNKGQIPSGNSSLFKPYKTWRSKLTKKGQLHSKAQCFQDKALRDLTTATEILKLAEKELKFTAQRDQWRKWLRTKYQIFMGCIASARAKDTRLLEFTTVLRYFGFFHIDFVSDELMIGIMQDLAWLVGCKCT